MLICKFGAKKRNPLKNRLKPVDIKGLNFYADMKRFKMFKNETFQMLHCFK